MSGLYGGRYRNSAPADFMSCSTRAPLWAGKLSMTTISPCERVGTRHFSTHSSNRAAFRACASSPTSRKMTVAVAFAGFAHGVEPVEPSLLNPDQAFALRVELRLEGYGAERERGGNRLVGFNGDGDADHALTGRCPGEPEKIELH